MGAKKIFESSKIRLSQALKLSDPLTHLGVQTRNCPLVNTKKVVKTGSNPVKKRQSASKADYRKSPENERFPGFVSNKYWK